jgi:hypothetical protein
MILADIGYAHARCGAKRRSGLRERSDSRSRHWRSQRQEYLCWRYQVRDEFFSGYVENLIRTEVENQVGKHAGEKLTDIMVEVAVNAAGNDLGTSDYIVGGSSRSKGTIDLTTTVRDLKTGGRLSTQKVLGRAKCQQERFLGVSGAGAYFVLKGDDWQIVEDTAYTEE